MTSFAESQGLTPFDWNRFLARAEHGEISTAESEEATELSRAWPTCACGNLCASIPRHETGMPADDELRFLGGQFHIAVMHIEDARKRDDLDGMERCARKAIYIMQDIEERAALLLSTPTTNHLNHVRNSRRSNQQSTCASLRTTGEALA